MRLSSLSKAGCQKPSCSTGSDTLHRHHKRHQAMWLGIFSWRKGEKVYDRFVEEYNAFLPKHIALICDRHHAEIHSIYDRIIIKDRDSRGKALYRYTWAEANELMDKLERAFNVWYKKSTPGYSPARLRKERRSRKRRK